MIKRIMLWAGFLIILTCASALAQSIPCRFDERWPVKKSEVQETEDGMLFIMGEEPEMQLLVTPHSPYFAEIQQALRADDSDSYLSALIQFGKSGVEKVCGVVPSLVSQGKLLSFSQEGNKWRIRQMDDISGTERELWLTPQAKCYIEAPEWLNAMMEEKVWFSITPAGYILECGK